MALAPVDLLASIVAAHARNLGGLDTLTVQCSSRGVLVTTSALSHLGPQRVVEPLPRSIITPLLEVGGDTLPRWILPRQHAPLASTHYHIQDRIDHRSHL